MITPAPRFTRDGSDALEKLIAETCEEIGREVTRIVPVGKFQALLLAGGYGRGEGGVLSTPDGDAPYNDPSFFYSFKVIRGSTSVATEQSSMLWNIG